MKKKPLQVNTKCLTAKELATLTAELAATPMDLRKYITTTKNTTIAFKLINANTCALRETMF